MNETDHAGGDRLGGVDNLSRIIRAQLGDYSRDAAVVIVCVKPHLVDDEKILLK